MVLVYSDTSVIL